MLRKGLVHLYPVSTRNELADIGTKSLGEDAFIRIKSVITGKVRLSAILSTDPNLEHIWLACSRELEDRGDVGTHVPFYVL